MKTPKTAYLTLVAILLTLILGSCVHSNRYAPAHDITIETYHNSRNSLTWWGVYEGIIPSASGSGINVRITLNRDYTFELSYEYIGRDDSVSTASGTFRWDDAGRTITLQGRDGFPFHYPAHYQVGEMFLRQLDMDGNPIEGQLAKHYILQKVDR